MSLVSHFETERPRLVGLAYRMLGSLDDAEDLVQDAYLRWQQAATESLPASPPAFLTTLVTRMAIDRWRQIKARRENYPGTWLPEPVATKPDGDPTRALALAESLSLALLVVLETLSPVERAVYLLREIFGYEYDEVAEIVESSVENCRQYLHRARQRIAAGQVRRPPPLDEQRRLIESFLAACATGEVQPLAACLAEDVAAHSDGGGRVPAARRSVHGRDAVARYVLGTIKKSLGAAELRFIQVNGQWGLVTFLGEQATNVILIEFHLEQIQAIRTIRNPDKLRRFTRSGDASAGYF